MTPSANANTATPPPEPIAVVGIGCRFPGAIHGAADLWRALLERRNAVGEVPKERWDAWAFHDPDLARAGRIRTMRGGFLRDVDKFDAEFFGYFPAEASRMDPQQRLLLEVAYEALEDAGTPREAIAGTRTSVFVGAFMYDWLCALTEPAQRHRITPYVGMGTHISALANRVSFCFDLKGPSITLDTACSSSLVAIHLACRSLWSGEAEAALAGGVNLILRPETSIMLSRAGFLSPEGACRAFDARGDGYVRGEGAGIVYLKPLARALAEGDDIYATIRAIAVNQDGRVAEGFTVPNPEAQAALIREALAQGHVAPRDVWYVEAHGTGTPVGDPIECRAIGAALGAGRSEDQSCLIGSIKTNLGHLEGASGVAGFIKAALVARNGVAPPSLHFEVPNPNIDFEGLRLRVVGEPVVWPHHDRPVYVGINSFGADGTNAHAILEAPPRPRERAPAEAAPLGRPRLFIFSAHQPEALKTVAGDCAGAIAQGDAPLEDLSSWLATRRSRHAHRLYVYADTRAELVQRLEVFARGESDPVGDTVLTDRAPPSSGTPRIAFVYSGQGGQWPGMGLALAEKEPVFREALERVDAAFQRRSGWSLIDEIRREASSSQISKVRVVQPAIMAVQIALTELLAARGLRPTGVTGHSIGELAAAWASGALDLEQTVDVVHHRSRILDRVSGQGAMLAVGLELEEAERRLAPFSALVSIAAENGPAMLTLAGGAELLARIAQSLEAEGIFARFVAADAAYHSPQMEPLRADLLDSLASLRGRPTSIDLYSTVTARREPGTHIDGSYFYQNVRAPVRLVSALDAMLGDGFDLFVEIGPHPVLLSGATKLFERRKARARAVPAMTRKEPEQVTVRRLIASATADGALCDREWRSGQGRRSVKLPRYPFLRRRHWFESEAEAQRRALGPLHPLLSRATRLAGEEGTALFELPLDAGLAPFVSDHRVVGTIVWPATGHMEMARAAAEQLWPHRELFLEDVRFESALLVPEAGETPLDVRLEVTSGEGDYTIFSRPGGTDGSWTRNSAGRINVSGDRFPAESVDFAALRAMFRDADRVDVEAFYRTAAAGGLAYGPRFQCVRELWHRGAEMLGRVELPDALAHDADRFGFHPALLDACLHVVMADIQRRGRPTRVYLPWRIARARFFARPTRAVWAYVRVRAHDADRLTSDTWVFDDEGKVVFELRGLTCKHVPGSSSSLDPVGDGSYAFRWEACPVPDAGRATVSGLRACVVVGEGDALMTLTCSVLRDRLPGVAVSSIATGGSAKATDVRARSAGEPLLPLPCGLSLDRRTTLLMLAPVGSTDLGSELTWRRCAEALLTLGGELQTRDAVPNVVVVTSGGAQVHPGDRPSPAAAISSAIARVFLSECPHVRVCVVDLPVDPKEADFLALVEMLRTARTDVLEVDTAIRGGVTYLRRLVRLTDVKSRPTMSLVPSGASVRAHLLEKGALDRIEFRAEARHAPGPGEVAIDVRAAGLNFKDVLNGMGILGEEAVMGGLTGGRLGLEVAGVVSEVGPGVDQLHPGDAVMARAPGGFAGRIVTPASCVVSKPARLSFAQAAALPAAYLTVLHGLKYLARLERGEVILVHSATGGVGLAAIELARATGATVIATAGTPVKRAYLKERLGIQHVFDSRALAFRDDVMAATDGRGVDVVLNSLTGRALIQGLKCLAPHGRFVELGKTDVFKNVRVGLAHLAPCVSVHVVDLDRVAVDKPTLHRRHLEELASLLERGAISPLPVTTFPYAELGAALQSFARALHIGKYVVTLDDTPVQVLPPRTLDLAGNRTFLVTGGTGGFGLELAKLLCDRGARHLVLGSRSGIKRADDQVAIQALEKRGVSVRVARIDVSDFEAVRRLVAEIETGPAPLAGVVHCAGLIDDARMEKMTWTRFVDVFRPKALGAWNLHRATLELGAHLDLFLMTSSIASAFGIQGQSNYAAANAVLDTLAETRQALGLPGCAVGLGILGDYAGMSRVEAHERDLLATLEQQGLFVMPLPEVLARVEAALVDGDPHRVVADVDWKRFAAAYPHYSRDSRFAALVAEERTSVGSHGAGGLRAALAALDPSARATHISEVCAGGLATILGLETGRAVDLAQPLEALALDSLALNQVRAFILRQLDVNVPFIELLKGPSLTQLGERIASDLEARGAASDGSNATSTVTAGSPSLVGHEGTTSLGPWLLRGRTTGSEPVRLVCFHSMGVGASLFTSFLLSPMPGIDVVAIQTPGREERSAEPLVTTFDTLVDQIAEVLPPLLDRPVIVWGHSFGGIVAFEVVRRLRKRHAAFPAEFMVTGTIAPQTAAVWQQRDVLLRALVEDNSAEYLLSLARYVDDASFVRTILPLMRRDTPLLLGYRYVPQEPLEVPILAWGARQDDVVYLDEIAGWREQTSSRFRLEEVDGDHWFLNRNREAIRRALVEIAERLVLAGSTSSPVPPTSR